jgi:hypothetical protein
MNQKTELEIQITPEGEVTVTVRGAKGKECLKYKEWIERFLGKAKEFQYTSEFYEQDVRIEPEIHQRRR